MKTAHWFFIACMALFLGFAGGYTVSARTGSEPGYFDAVEAAGYGGGGELLKGVSIEVQDYYKNLLEEE